LGFPCNQFGLQENSSNPEIPFMLKYVRPGKEFEPNFPLFQKLLVNGDNAHPLFHFLRTKQPETPPTTKKWVINTTPSELAVTPCKPGDIQWNFEKFLVDREGNVISRYAPSVAFDVIEADIQKVLSQQPQQQQ